MAPPDRTARPTPVEFVSETLLPTAQGEYTVRAYRDPVSRTEPVAITFGDVRGLEDVPGRVHDECFTSEVLGSLKCDCSDQLHFAMDFIKRRGPGVVIYLRQEGRGIGLANKIAAYALQEDGHDTVDANRLLGLPDDVRSYAAAAEILDDLGIRSVRLMTNNPRKESELLDLGVVITSKIPVLARATAHNAGYLAAKSERMGHLLPSSFVTVPKDEVG